MEEHLQNSDPPLVRIGQKRGNHGKDKKFDESFLIFIQISNCKFSQFVFKDHKRFCDW